MILFALFVATIVAIIYYNSIGKMNDDSEDFLN